MLRRLAITFGVLLLVAILGGAWVWTQLRAAPRWYAPPDPADTQVAELADRVEYGLVENFHKIRASADPWAVRIRASQVNAWLSARLPEWIAHEGGADWPAELGVPQVHVDENGIDIAVGVTLDSRSQVVVARVVPRIDAGRLHLDIDRVGLGRLGLPGASVEKLLELLDGLAPGGTVDEASAPQLLAYLVGEQMAESSVDLSDGRRVEILAVTCVPGAIELTSRTIVGDRASGAAP